ncbi:MAG: DUF6807 family protein, partial [Verrucomicrobiota bacterium]
MKWCLSVSVVFAVPSLCLAGFAFVEQGEGLELTWNGELVSRFVVDEGNKPFLYPVLGPGGVPMTRSYPMEEVAGESQDHPHHRSLWFGHQGIQGVDTWHEAKTIEERAEKKKDPVERDAYVKEAMAKLGRTRPMGIGRIMASGEAAELLTRNDYEDAEGNKLLADERLYRFRMPTETERAFEVVMTFRA